MKRTLTYEIEPEAAGLTVGQYLEELGCSRNVISRLKTSPAGLCVDGTEVFSSYRLTAGETLTICLPEEETPQAFAPEPMDLNFVYEDEDLLVVNKASGVPVHPSPGHYTGTLANGMAWYFLQKGEPFVYRAVNRLDRDTTGLLILARNQLSASILSSMGEKRLIRREYLAIAKGKVPEEGIIDAPIARKEGSILERIVSPGGETARTRYRTLLYRPSLDLSLVSLRLETGRTHQIRVHMAHIGHPLPGDFLYCPDFSVIRRQALHSHALTFPHPITKKELHFEAPLPDDMQFILSGVSLPATAGGAGLWGSGF